MARIIVGVVLVLVVLVILVVKEGILLSFVLREILVLVKLLCRRREIVQVHMLSPLGPFHRVPVDRVDKMLRSLRQCVDHQESSLWLDRT